MKRRIIVDQVTNGWIVRVKKTGLSLLKDPYETPVYVFQTYRELDAFLSAFFSRGELP